MSKPKPTGAPHVFVLDQDVPADPLDRSDDPARACLTCRLIGRPGDSHHNLPDVPEQRAHQRRYEPEADDA